MAGATLIVGNVEILALHDNESALPLSMTFPACRRKPGRPISKNTRKGSPGPIIRASTLNAT